MQIRHFLLCCLLATVFLLPGCAGRQSPGKDLWKEGFCSEIRGEMNGIPFSAVISGSIAQDGSPKGSVRFLSFGEKSEILLCRETDGTVSVTQGGYTVRVPEEHVAGLLAPLTCLPDGEQTPAAVEKEQDGGFLYRYPDGKEVLFSEDGVPVRAEDEQVRFAVVWWEWGAEEHRSDTE